MNGDGGDGGVDGVGNVAVHTPHTRWWEDGRERDVVCGDGGGAGGVCSVLLLWLSGCGRGWWDPGSLIRARNTQIPARVSTYCGLGRGDVPVKAERVVVAEGESGVAMGSQDSYAALSLSDARRCTPVSQAADAGVSGNGGNSSNVVDDAVRTSHAGNGSVCVCV